MPYKRILAAVDGSDVSKKAALEAIRIAKSTSGVVFAVYVIPMGPEMIEYFKLGKLKRALKSSAEEAIEELKDHAHKEGVPFNVIVKEGDPSENIMEIAEQNNCDLIILGRRGRSALEKILVGSVAERVAGDSSVPVLLVPG